MNYFFRLMYLFILLGMVNMLYAGDHENEYSIFHRTIDIENPTQQLELRYQSAWQNFEERNGQWYVAFNTISGFPLRAGGHPIKSINDGPLEEKAKFFLSNELAAYELPLEDLEFQSVNETDRHYYVRFVQKYKGVEVWNANTQVIMTKDHHIIGFTMNIYEPEGMSVAPILSQEEVLGYFKTDIHGLVEDVIIQGLKILPIPAENGYKNTLVYEGLLKVINEKGLEEKLYTMVDAGSGIVYYRHNEIVHYLPKTTQSQGEWTVMGYATENANDQEKLTFLPNMRVVINGEEYKTDVNGKLEVEITEPTMATVYMDGDFCTVYDGENRISSNIPRYEVMITNDSQEIILPEEADLVAVSVYKAVNTVHDWMKAWLPAGMTNLDYDMPAHINIGGGTCNAFADGSSINFFQQGGGCWTFALMADVIYHEYGHNINTAFYNFLGGQFFNGALHEGYADIWALSITEEPILSRGYELNSSNSFIRRYDTNPKVYPQDLIGEVHADGEIIAGAWWDLGQEIGVNKMFEIFVNSHFGTPMRGNGEEGVLFTDVLFQALIADDDNGDLTDGTPNSEAIFKAFDLHGIKLRLAAQVEHDEVNVGAAESTIQLDFKVNVDFNYLSILKNIVVKHRYNRQSEYLEAIASSFTNDENYSAWIVSESKGTIIDYYIEVQNTVKGGVPFVEPNRAGELEEYPNLPYQMLIGFDEKIVDDFSESESQWTIGASDDDAVSGEWEIGSPNPTSNDVSFVQMGEDRTPTLDNFCAFTGNTNGNSVGANDVDGGKTTLFSPVFDIKGYVSPALSYYRWYSNNQGANPGNDFWEVYVSGDGGEWVEVENANVADHSWRFSALRVKDYVTAVNTVQLQFVASDPLIGGLPYSGGSLVEAGVDDVVLYDVAEGNPVGIDDYVVVSDLVKIFPNPVKDVLNIINTNVEEGNATIELFDLRGKEVAKVENVKLQDYQLNTSHLQSGVYLIRIIYNEQLQQQKVLIQN